MGCPINRALDLHDFTSLATSSSVSVCVPLPDAAAESDGGLVEENGRDTHSTTTATPNTHAPPRQHPYSHNNFTTITTTTSTSRHMRSGSGKQSGPPINSITQSTPAAAADARSLQGESAFGIARPLYSNAFAAWVGERELREGYLRVLRSINAVLKQMAPPTQSASSAFHQCSSPPPQPFSPPSFVALFGIRMSRRVQLSTECVKEAATARGDTELAWACGEVRERLVAVDWREK